GYRRWTYSYDQVRRAAIGFAVRLENNRITKGEKVIIWGENRAEWVVALWGCVLAGVIVVPIDYRASIDLVRRVHDIVRSRCILIGDEISVEGETEIPIWRLAEIDWKPDPARYERPDVKPDDTAEIIFTSGATAE